MLELKRLLVTIFGVIAWLLFFALIIWCSISCTPQRKLINTRGYENMIKYNATHKAKFR